MGFWSRGAGFVLRIDWLSVSLYLVSLMSALIINLMFITSMLDLVDSYLVVLSS